MKGWVFGCTGRLDDGIALMKKELDTTDKIGGVYRPQFTEGFDTFDLKEAKALLDALAA